MTITSDQVFLLNKMNNTANKVQLGTLIQNAESIVAAEIALANGSVLVGNGSGVAAAVVLSGAITTTNAGVTSLASGAVSLAKLAAGVTPSHVVKYAGKYQTIGGSPTEAATVTGVAATDIVVASIQSNSGVVTLLTAAPTLNTVTFVFSADPVATVIVSYQVLRAAA